MTNHDNSNGPLEHAERRWRQEMPSIPAGLVEATLARVTTGATVGDCRMEQAWWRTSLWRGTAVAAGVALLVSVALFLVVAGRGRVALGEVIEQARDAKAVRFTVWYALDDPDSKRTKFFVVTEVAPEWLLIDMDVQQFRINKALDKQLTVVPRNKTARLQDGALDSGDSKLAVAIFDDIRQLDPADGKALEEKVLEGHKAQGFALDRTIQGERVRVELWADTQTQRIVLVKMKSPVASRNARGVSHDNYLFFTDFNWNPKMDPAEASFDPPKGYILLHDGPANEKDAVEMLRQFADLADGLPSALTSDVFRDVLRKKAELLKNETQSAHGGATPAPSEAMLDLNNQVRLIDRGLGFVVDDEAGADWHYAPNDAKVGEKGKPVLWYRPAGKEDYRVIDADFSVHDRKAEELPATPPMKIDWPKPDKHPATFVIPDPPQSSSRP